ncbi:MAG TPA: GtrA family protein [Steroidobacteraceae bacterium]|jgi:putative flippase GtrA|nr:GtrA family protein [Steroidobacteraceae bacterium]
MKILIREALAYAAVSGFALVVDIGILWILVHYLAWPYLPAAAASFSVGLLVGYALSVTAVFKYRRLESQPLELASFTAIGVVGLGVNITAISFGVRYLGAHYLVAKCGAAGLTFIWNFAARRQLLFVRRRTAA